MMFYRHAGAGGWIRGWQSAQVGHSSERVSYQSPYHPIILSPSRAVIMAEAGLSKQDAQAWLHRNCRVTLQEALGTREMPVDANGNWLTHPGNHLRQTPARRSRRWKLRNNIFFSYPAGRPTTHIFSTVPTALPQCRSTNR